MGARSGNNYLSSLRKLKADVWLGGERVADPTTHPALMQCARSIASLYDMQIEHPEAMTYRVEDGDRAGLSFIHPQSADDVHRRSAMMRRWAEFSGGMLGRTPDYLNASIAAMAAAHEFFASADKRYGDHIVEYYRQARRNDWCATHTLLNPRASRAAGWAGQSDTELALRLVEQTTDGIVVSGARMLATLGPLSEELLVFPSTVLKEDPSQKPFALAFAVQCNTPGLKFFCRDPFDAERSHFDHPLASRFEEMDCIVVSDKVLAPWAPLDCARNLFPKLYTRMVEILELNSSSSLMATPSERDFKGPMLPTIERYFGQADAAARERGALYRLAWDVAGSSLGGRRVLYERFFFGDPVRMASALVDNTDLAPLVQRVKDFMARTD